MIQIANGTSNTEVADQPQRRTPYQRFVLVLTISAIIQPIQWYVLV